MPLKSRIIKAGLENKGFIMDNQGHHIYFRMFVDGKDIGAWTYISHGHSDIGDDLLSMMAKQLKLNKSQLIDLIECPMSKEEFLEVWDNNQNGDLKILHRG